MQSIPKRPVFNDAVLYPEGLAILLHTAGWYEREWQNHVKHIEHLAICKERGIDLSLVLKGRSMNDGQYPRLQLLRPLGIGFDRAELIAFLDRSQIAHSLKPSVETHSLEPTAATGTQNKPKRTRRDLLTPAIEIALKRCAGSLDAPSVWGALLSMIDEGVKPLIGVSEDGIKWQDSNDETKFLSLRSLRGRLSRIAENHAKEP